MTGSFDSALAGILTCYLTGLVVFLGASLGFYFVVRTPTAVPREAGFIGAFDTGCGRWYRQIAEEGYRYDPGLPSNVRLFPLYPLLARGLASGCALPTGPALLIVSNASFAIALVVFTRYLRLRFPNAAPRLADAPVVALGLFPVGCFFRMCYSESTFLLLALFAMYGLETLDGGCASRPDARRRQHGVDWRLPAVVFTIGLATAARPTGVALLAPLALYVWRSQPTVVARLIRAVIFLPLACWGLIVFLAFQHFRFNNAFAAVHAQSDWRFSPRLDWSHWLASLVTLEPVRAVYNPNAPGYWAAADQHGVSWFSLVFANPLYFFGALVLVACGVWRRWLNARETLLTLSLLLIPYFTRAQEMRMVGMGRFVAVAFPIYIVMGELIKRLPFTHAVAIMAISAFFLATYSALFAAGYLIE